MKKTDPKKTELRAQAETKLIEIKKRTGPLPSTDADTRRLVHELQVHQIELEMQNEELVQARADSEAVHRQYTDLYDFAPVGYFTLTRDGTISQVNLTGATLLCAERSKLLTRRFGLFVAPAARPAFAAFLEKVFIAGGEKQTCEMELLCQDKTESFCAQIEAVCDESHEREACRAVVVDISERVRAEETLRQSEIKFRQTFDISPVGIVMVGLDKRFIRCNLAFSQSLGYGTEELVGKLIEDVTLPEDSQIGMAEMMAIMKGEIAQSQVHKRYLRKDGQVIWGEVTISLIRDSEGRAQYFLAIIQDVTGRKQAEDALRESEDKFKYVFEHASVGKSLTLPTGEISVNQAMCDMLGYSQEELKTRKWQEITHPDDIELTQNAINALISGEKESVRFNKRYLHKNSSVVWTDISTALRRDKDSQPLYFMTTINDITERVQAEEALAQQNDALLKLNRFSIELTMLSSEDNLEALIARQIKEIAGAEVAIFSEYDPANRTTTAQHIEMKPGLLDKVVHLLGTQVKNIHSVVSDEMYREMTTDIIGMRRTLYEASFGAISRPIGAAIQALLKVDRFIGIAYLIEGKLYGTSLLGMSKDQPDPPREILENFIYLAALSLQRKLAEEALLNANKHLAYAQSAARAGMWDWDMATGILTWSPEMFKLFGFDPNTSSPTFDLWRSVLHSEDRQKAEEQINQAVLDHTPLVNEYRIVTPSGQMVWIGAQGDTSYAADGTPLRMSGICIDITERKQAEDVVRNRNRMLLATHNIMLKIGTELHLPILLSNILGQAQSLLDADRGGGIYLYESGGDVLRLVHGTGINQGRDNITIQVGEGVAGRVYQTSQPLIIDNYTNWKAHATILVADPPSTVMGVPLLLNAKVFGVLTLIANSQLRKFTDQDMQQAEMFAAQAAIAIQNAQLYQQARQEITERVQAEKELKESKALFETVVENVPLMVFLKEAKDLRFVIFNRAGEELLGYDRQALLGKNNLDLFPPEQAAHFMAKDREVLDGEAGMLDIPEEPLQTARKGQRLLHTRKVCIRGADGTTKYLLGISEDITERKQNEKELKAYSEHLEEMVEDRTRELTDAQEKLVRHEKLATLGQLAGGVGHELRNPLAVINAAVYYLKLVQPEASDKVREYHAMIEQEVQNSEKIITDLLDFARIKSVDREAVSVSEIFQCVLERYPVPPSVTLSLDLSPDLPKTYADPRHVKQVLGNLVINACQAMKDGGKLTVDGGQLTVDGISWVRISVKDTGVGISPENMKKLFEPLFTTKTKGIGLGLSISRKLIEANGGRIEVESEPGKGSTFTLVLPVSNKPG
jgi:PAS domain S-box-containing protein